MDQDMQQQSSSLSPGYDWQSSGAKPAIAVTDKPTKRAPVACKRCRRLRIKCIHESASTVPPCVGCRKAGPATAEECIFPPRGSKDGDREFRRSRVKAGREHEQPRGVDGIAPTSNTSIHVLTPPPTASTVIPERRRAHWDLLPPQDEVIQGCRVLGNSYFQLGFLPKAIFLERLATDFESVGIFLLLSILSVSARFTPCLIERYGGGAKATEYFIAKATELVPVEMYKASLDRTQAFFLLAIADWGNGNKNRSSTHMGLAVAMAGILCLHREETYQLPPNATPDQVVESEMARRTFWMIESQTNLHSGHSTPFPFAFSDMTAQLPCEESDFAFGIIPAERAVLLGTEAANAHPNLASTPSRSLFASLIQSHNLWGQVARRACRSERVVNCIIPKPWEENSEYSHLSNALREWEKHLPLRQQWSIRNLRGYKAQSLDLAYLATVMVLRLSNIVLRRIYLPDIMAAAASDNTHPSSLAPAGFWEQMSEELFQNVHNLYEQIDAYLPLRTREEGFPPIIVFCAYICGSLATYLWKTPHLCTRLSPLARPIFERCLEALTDLQYAWPMALRWHEALRKATIPADDSIVVPTPGVLFQNNNAIVNNDTNGTQERRPMLDTQNAFPKNKAQPPPSGQDLNSDLQRILNSENMAHSGAADHNLDMYQQHGSTELSSSNTMGLPIDIFEAELTAFLQGDVPEDIWGSWDWQ